uniref:Zinc finger, GRF-type n=1 Tax=Tanacetum cinerariifolium TaxID=118510 RepID=A0A6L2JX47_TANCI|nr:hypothetical protein [Tanacetum cinerariifolium]
MVVCTCGEDVMVRMTWTNRNSRRRFCAYLTYGKNCPFHGWVDPPMCPYVVDVILGLLRSRNQMEDLVDIVEEMVDFKEHRDNTKEIRVNMEQNRANLED